MNVSTPDRRHANPELAEPSFAHDLGLDRALLVDLALKTLFYGGRMTQAELSDALKVAGTAMQEILHAITKDDLAHILGSEGGIGPSHYEYALTQKGVARANEALARSGYVGPAPVALADYVRQTADQTVRATTLTRSEVQDALGGLVLADDTLDRLGRAASSSRSTLLYGNSGNGKTSAVKALGVAAPGTIYIPYAIEMFGQIVRLFDPSKHVVAHNRRSFEDGTVLSGPRSDRRWVAVERPVIWAGAELTRSSIELQWDERTRLYEAPLQLKANGGTLIIDDFGRQSMPAAELLNRWIGALEGDTDHLTLHTGQMVETPFDVMVLFSTNLVPSDLADDAFLRRIRYKIEIPNPSPDEFRNIFRQECDGRGVSFDEAAVNHLLKAWYGHDRDLRGCHPRDLVEAICDAALYDGHAPALTTRQIDEACSTYFLHNVS
jgi:predicted ATPase with chaperone activity